MVPLIHLTLCMMQSNQLESASCLPPLSREQVIRAVERRGPSRVPMVFAHWWGEGLREQYGERLDPLKRYPEDAAVLWLPKFDPAKMDLSWDLASDEGGLDSRVVLDDWAKLDEFIEKLPAPEEDPRFEDLAREAERIRREDRYLLVGWWRLFFETGWGLRGMEDLLIDYYEDAEELHRLHEALLDQFTRTVVKAHEVLQPDGFWTSDDIGHQTQPMMSREVFDRILKPFYRKIGSLLQQQKMHWWFHSCGNVEALFPSLIEAGVTVFHPVQKHTMREEQVVATHGGSLVFLAGFDVQQTLREATPEGVRKEVRFLIDTFDRPEGGMAIAAGNGIVAGTPIENIEAFLDEAYHYGKAHREAFSTGKP